MLESKFYIYRHIRPDTNEVFYIGKGNNLDKRKSKYRRAFETLKRSDFWDKVYNKNNKKILVDILFECETEQQANEKEIEFILLYGRKDLGKGSLVNLTDGGDGSFGHIMSEENRQRKRDIGSPMKGKKHTIETLLKLSESAKKRTTPNPFKGKKHTDAVKISISKRAKENPNKPKTKFINIDTGEILDGVIATAKSVGINKVTLLKNLRNNYINNHTCIMYYDDYINGRKVTLNKERSRIQSLCKKVIDKETNKVYESVKQASLDKGLDVSTLRRRLNGIFKNNTTLEYYGL